MNGEDSWTSQASPFGAERQIPMNSEMNSMDTGIIPMNSEMNNKDWDNPDEQQDSKDRDER